MRKLKVGKAVKQSVYMQFISAEWKGQNSSENCKAEDRIDVH